MTAAGPDRSFSYGHDDHERQVIHVVEPATRARPRPAVVLFHGGGPTGGSPLQDLDWAEPLAQRGYVALMAGYRLFDAETGANAWPAQIEDAQRAIRWVRAHAADLDVDPGRVAAMGHSSGGHLAGLLGTTDVPYDADAALDGIPSRVDCVVSLAGDADLTVPYADPATTRTANAWLGGILEEITDVWRAASPAHNVDDRTTPFLIIHGNRDEGVPIQMSRNLATALARAGIEYVLAEFEAGHMDVCERADAHALWNVFLDLRLHPER